MTAREPSTLAEVLRWMIHDPWDALGRRWNYKSAVLSALARGGLFFATTLAAGAAAAVGAFLAEFCLRLTTAGFYGAMTQAFRRVRPARTGMLAAMVLLPAVAHSLEFLVHSWRGTPGLGRSMAVSVAFTAVSTAFNLFAMRHGALIVGPQQRPLVDDLRALPRLVCLFVAAGAAGLRVR